MFAALAGVFVGLVVFAGVAWLISQDGSGVDIRLGDDRFEAGRTDRLAAEVERNGPILFPDASPQRARDIYLQHLGDEPGEGWLAFLARSPDADDRTCVLQWDADAREFSDPCGDATYPADGEGLPHFPTEVDDDGVLSVDLRAPAEDE
jgi:hypothetical protein